MESCLKRLPKKSYNTFGYIVLTLFVLTGVVITGIASGLNSTLQCNPDKNLVSDLSTKKYIEVQCSLQYTQEFQRFLPLRYMCLMNFGIVFVLSVIYAYTVKHRVEIYIDVPTETRKTFNDIEEETSLLPNIDISRAASDPIAYRISSSRYFIFTIYITYLIVCRVIPLLVFAVLLIYSSNFPTQFDCTSPIEMSHFVNSTEMQRANVLIVDCTNIIGGREEQLVIANIVINFVFGLVACIELLHLSWLAWKSDKFYTDLEFCSVYILRKRKRIRKLMENLRNSVSEGIFVLHDDFGEKRKSSRKLQDMYVNVIIQDGRDNQLLKEKKSADKGKLHKSRHEIYQTHLDHPRNAIILTKTEDLFKSTSGTNENPKSILVVGRPGIGKTLLSKKLFYQWQQQTVEFWHDKLVFLIRFRSFNKGRTSLREMLRPSDGFKLSTADFNHIYEYVCLNPSEAILIFDGLDELKVDDALLTEELAVKSHNEVTHILVIFKELIEGELLPGVTVLTTSRPTAEHIYGSLKFDREVEILGFNVEQIEDYVYKFCCNDIRDGEKIWNFIKDSPEYLSLCYVPVNCYIVCLALKESIQVDDDGETSGTLLNNAPKTITELYKRATKILLFRHHSNYIYKSIPKDYMDGKLPVDLQNDMNKLENIAMRGMENGELIFQFESGDESFDGLPNCGLLNKLEDKRQNVFCFLHLTVQEFLAALHLVKDLCKVESFLSEYMDIPRWHLVIQFVAGLIGDKIRELNKALSERSSAEHSKQKVFIKRLCQRFQDFVPAQLSEVNIQSLLVIKCLHEMQDEDVINSIDCEAENEELSIEHVDIAPAESVALFKFLGYIKNLHKMVMISCDMENFGLREFAKFLSGGNEIRILTLMSTNLTDKALEYLCASLKSGKCKLTQLDITGNHLVDKSAEYLSDALRSDNCKLTQLNIRGNKLTHEAAKNLSDGLKNDNCKLIQLGIGGRKLTDEAAEYLSDALKSDNCKLTQLSIGGRKLTDKAAEYLSDALKSDNCKLTQLSICGNKSTDKVAEYLSDALKSDNCKLTQLDISKNNLTDKAAEYLSDALKSDNCKLTNLDISGNKLTAKGKKYLTDKVLVVVHVG